MVPTPLIPILPLAISFSALLRLRTPLPPIVPQQSPPYFAIHHMNAPHRTLLSLRSISPLTDICKHDQLSVPSPKAFQQIVFAPTQSIPTRPSQYEGLACCCPEPADPSQTHLLHVVSSCNCTIGSSFSCALSSSFPPPVIPYPSCPFCCAYLPDCVERIKFECQWVQSG